MVHKKIYLLVKAYPEKSKKYGSSICSAGITTDGKWIRIYPIDLNYYSLNQGLLRKWNLIEGEVFEASEKLSRKESYKIKEKSIKLLDDSLAKMGTSKHEKEKIWEQRNRLIIPILNKSIEQLKELQSKDHTSLGIIKPRKFNFHLRKDLNNIKVIKSKTVQKNLDGRKLIIPDQIEKIFSYQFWCDDPRCNGHDMICEDWELMEAYRSWKRIYKDPDELEKKLMEKFYIYMKKRNLHFIVGTTAQFGTWVIIGLYYPPKKRHNFQNIDQFFA